MKIPRSPRFLRGGRTANPPDRRDGLARRDPDTMPEREPPWRSPLTMPRFRIAWLMLIVAFVAFDFGAIRSLSGVRDGFSELVGMGILPMANVLVIVAVIGAKGRGSRPFLAGFVASGQRRCSAASPGPGSAPIPSRGSSFDVVPIANWLRTNPSGPANFVIAGVLLGLPQLSFALLGASCRRDGSGASSPVTKPGPMRRGKFPGPLRL